MSEKLTYCFDRLGWLKREGFLDRRILFLDLNFWIKLSEARQDVYVELRHVLSQEISAGRLVCPVSPSLLLEVKKQPASDKRDEYCRLMDEFSQGLSIRNSPSIFVEEFGCIVEEQPLLREIAYSHFLEALSSGMHIDFPEHGWSQTDADQAADLIFDYLDGMSVIEIVNVEVDKGHEGSIQHLRSGLSELCRQEKEQRTANHSSSRSIEEAEFAATVRALFPQIFRVFSDLGLASLWRLSAMSLDEKREILDQCPSFWCQYKLIAALRSNRVQIKENDLWDLEHITPVLPYVDCVACDGGTRHLCSDMLKLDERYSTKIVSEEGDLMKWILKTE